MKSKTDSGVCRLTKPYPKYDFCPESWTGTLTAPFKIQTQVTKYPVNTLFFKLGYHGMLRIAEGYTWDFGSGPAVDTPNMVVASLVHDAGCDLTTDGAMPFHYREEWDAEFRRQLKAYGTSLPRRWWCWLGVRYDANFKSSPPPEVYRPRRHR